ncbi:antibiotic biosynthesis monooxygenase family protein [Nocardia sp. NPDC050435]|uniref:putative quinol monooxygenase n=1 Tax=Nocardia sp. NPDC050435 TaxID=3155040 RepID=UPI0033F60417
MVIVAGHLEVDPRDRAAYLADCAAVVAQARSTPGCLDFSIAADLIDDARIVIFERWESRAAVEAFRAGGPSDAQTAAIRAASVAEYDIAAARSLT